MKSLYFNGYDYVIAESEADAVTVWEEYVGESYEKSWEPFKRCSDQEMLTIKKEECLDPANVRIPLTAWKEIVGGYASYRATAAEWAEYNDPQVLVSDLL